MSKELKAGAATAITDASRRDLVTTLLGVAASAGFVQALSGCQTDERESDPEESSASVAQALHGATALWVDRYDDTSDSSLRYYNGTSDDAGANVAVARGRAAPGDGGGGLFVWEHGVTTGHDAATIVVPATAPQGRWRRVFDGPLNVRWFGAKGDDNANDRAAIQAALDAAALAAYAGVASDGAQVYLPHGRYRLEGTTGGGLGASLRIPRTGQFRTITIAGDGPDATLMFRADAGLVFEGQLLDGCEGTACTNAGYVVIRDLTFGGHANRLFDWDFRNDVNFNFGHLRLYLTMERVTVRAGTGGTEDAAIHIFAGSDSRFEGVFGYGLNGEGGCLFWLESSARSQFNNCGITGTPGAFCRMTSGPWNGSIMRGGSMTLISCRAEGGNMVPEFHFEGMDNIVLISCSGEGEREYPAQFHFENCRTASLVGIALATADAPYTANRYAEGLLLDNCTNINVSGLYIPLGFEQPGDGAARSIVITSTCKSVNIHGASTTSTLAGNVAIETGAEDCHVEIRTQQGQEAVGTKTFDEVRASSIASTATDLPFFTEGTQVLRLMKVGAESKIYTDSQQLEIKSAGLTLTAPDTNVVASGFSGARIFHGSTLRIQSNADGLGFFGSSPVARPSVTGSTGGNAALTSLIAALESLGLIDYT